MIDSAMADEDAELLGDDWQGKIEKVKDAELLDTSVAALRNSFGRPLHLMRSLIGLSIEDAAQELGWSIERLQAAEDRSAPENGASLLEYMGALSYFALRLSGRVDERYALNAWGSSLSPSGVEAVNYFGERWATYGAIVTSLRRVA